MKKFFLLVFSMAVLTVFAVPSFATSGVEKLQGGAEKIVKSPLQIKDTVVEEYEAAEFKPFGVVGGLLKGGFYFVKDVACGVLDILTFPVDFDK